MRERGQTRLLLVLDEFLEGADQRCLFNFDRKDVPGVVIAENQTIKFEVSSFRVLLVHNYSSHEGL